MAAIGGFTADERERLLANGRALQTRDANPWELVPVVRLYQHGTRRQWLLLAVLPGDDDLATALSGYGDACERYETVRLSQLEAMRDVYFRGRRPACRYEGDTSLHESA